MGPASEEEGLDADLIRGETPAGRPRAYSRHWAQTSAGGAARARKEGLEGQLGLGGLGGEARAYLGNKACEGAVEPQPWTWLS